MAMNKPRYEEDEELMPSTDDTAIVTWASPMDICSFVHHLNRAYNLDLQRDDDLGVLDKGRLSVCPCFTYSDLGKQLFYILVQNPKLVASLGGTIDNYDIILFIHGRDAWDYQQSMFSDFDGELSAPNPIDWLGVDKYRHLKIMRDEVMRVDYFDFRNQDEPVSSVFEGMLNTNTSSMSKYFDGIKDSLVSILWAIDDAPTASK